MRWVHALLSGRTLSLEAAPAGSDDELALGALRAVEADGTPAARFADATELSRRLTRRASELSPSTRALVGICLVRLYRLSGRSHLALNALSQVAAPVPSELQAWRAWECLLAGAPSVSSEAVATGATAFADLVSASSEMLEAAKQGERPQFQLALARARRVELEWSAPRREMEALAALIDPELATSEAGVLAWRAGTNAEVPFGLQSISGEKTETDAEGYVLVVPGKRAVRFLAAGVRLNQTARNLAGPDEAGTGGTRTESALAVLALCGEEGISYAEFVRTMYGISYVPKRHQGMLDVLVHRMRARLAGVAELERVGSTRLALHVLSPFVIPDGRTAVDVQQRLLRVIGTFGRASAQQASKVLGIPRRTAHRLLQQLAACQSCRSFKAGGRVLYSINDLSA
ncbi:MAG: hypothetical protein SFV15_12210 [Polyangiaceae bacterium]|nr:hypothetical protein [Polyangiaceae bacterium]